jgi:hypothetical protein
MAGITLLFPKIDIIQPKDAACETLTFYRHHKESSSQKHVVMVT